jgi:hypothetical protein
VKRFYCPICMTQVYENNIIWYGLAQNDHIKLHLLFIVDWNLDVYVSSKLRNTFSLLGTKYSRPDFLRFSFKVFFRFTVIFFSNCYCFVFQTRFDRVWQNVESLLILSFSPQLVQMWHFWKFKTVSWSENQTTKY